jgi:hypothetical protein
VPDELPPEDDPVEHDDDETELSDVDREALGAAMAAIAAQVEMIRQLTGQFTKQLNAVQAYTARLPNSVVSLRTPMSPVALMRS